MENEKLILITGAAGLIGSSLVRHLNNQKKANLLLVDDLKIEGKWRNLVGKTFIDILSKDKLFEYLIGKEDLIDSVVHLGACSDTMECNADYLLENNYRYTIRLAEWALKYKKRFVYASSAATYGDGALGFDDDESKIETLRPLNMYAYSKQLVDLWMKREKVLDRVVGLKYFNVFGPNEYHKKHMASMVLKMMKHAQKEGVIHLYKSNDPQYQDGGQLRDFIYVKDAVLMTAAFLENREVSGIFNIGRGTTTSWNELASALFRALNQKVNINYIDMPEGLSKQYQNYTCANMNKFNRLFSIEPTLIDLAVKDYVQNYLINESRW